ncbi:hypothetical protein GCM10009087_56640 [Sphingomonas oligophenolica]
MAHTGQYSDLHYVRGQISKYENMIAGYRRKKDYWEISYFTGYLLGLEFFELSNFVSDEELPPPPLFFHPGVGQIDEAEFEREIRNRQDIHKLALAQAKRILKRSGSAGAEVIQHLPWA